MAAESRESYLLFDADCGLCQRWCDWARNRGVEPAVRFEPCQMAVSLRERAGVAEDACLEHAILLDVQDGQVVRVRKAAAAINGVLARMPGARNALYRAISWLYSVPGLRQVEEMGYRMVARNRYRMGGSCTRPE